jgi:hypothetical protein
VTIPDDKIAEASAADDRPLYLYQLAMTFHYGQNDFASRDDLAQRLPSVSVGDIVRLPDGRRFVVMPTGFREVPGDFTPPTTDLGGMYAYRMQMGL